MLPDAWNPSQYERFKAERSRPFHDLLGTVEVERVASAVDLGCGTGELTRELQAKLPVGARTVGIDSSQAMLDKAAAFAGGGLSFALGDLTAWRAPHGVDLIFANASLQWAGDQTALLTNLTAQLAPSGQLAFQVPANHDHLSHRLAAELAAEPEYAKPLQGYVRTSPVLSAEGYAELLFRLGYSRQRVRLEVYGHVLASARDVVEWVKGTLLTDYQRRMPAEAYTRFLVDFEQRLVAALGGGDRPYFYAFKRILAWAAR